MRQWDVVCGDALISLKALPDGCARCCVTSPPYWGLRDYGVSGQLGLEATPEAYAANLVAVFREVRRVLAEDGTLWLVIGDSYCGGGRGGNPVDSPFDKQQSNHGSLSVGPSAAVPGLKPKDLVGIPWRVAFALQADGWYLRSDIIWSKPNPMPESVTDRPTKAHEYLFLLSKRERYFYDAAAIAEPVVKGAAGSTFTEGKTGTNGNGRQQSAEARALKQDGHGRRHAGFNARWDASDGDERGTRNARTVWSIATQPYPEAHFATFPEKLAERCILAGSAVGDTVLDPFTGSGTTGAVAVNHGRRFVGIELNPAYVTLAEKRIADAAAQGSLFAPLLGSAVPSLSPQGEP
jgi:DNA modification methylase